MKQVKERSFCPAYLLQACSIQTSEYLQLRSLLLGVSELNIKRWILLNEDLCRLNSLKIF